MKKIIFTIFIFLFFVTSVNAGELFHLGEKVPDIVIYMDRINKQVYYQPKKILRNETGELVYCIQPGVVLSNNIYESYNDYNDIFNITKSQFERIKLIAYYGYNYKDHTDIKWYAITQYLIWDEIKPDNWVMYFSNLNHDRLDHIYDNEINEIYNLVNNHDDGLKIKAGYILNNRMDITIESNSEINNYKTSQGEIIDNNLVISNLKYGRNDITLSFINYNPVLFYYNNDGQNVFKRGDVFKENINFYVYVNAGKVKINECSADDFSNHFIGGTYEVLNEDNAILDTITCSESNCISNYLPIGFHKIRVKNLPDNYDNNEYIYDVEIKDSEETNIDICSLPKKVLKRTVIEPAEEDTYEYDDIVEIEEDEEIVDVPNTNKHSYLKYIFIILILISHFYLIKYDKNNI